MATAARSQSARLEALAVTGIAGRMAGKTPLIPASLLKFSIGITGLDEITVGGLPRGRPTLVAGGAGEYSIEIIDLTKNPALAAGVHILALPTLVRRFPEPIRKIIGDLSNEERVLVGLDLHRVKA